MPDENALALLRLVEDVDEIEELRAPLLEVLATPGRPHSERLLSWLRAQQNVEQAYLLDTAVLEARAAMNDLSAIPALSELATNDWSHRSVVGEAGR